MAISITLVRNKEHSVSMPREHIGSTIDMQSESSLDKFSLDLFLERSRDFCIPVKYVEDCDVEIPDNQWNWVPL